MKSIKLLGLLCIVRVLKCSITFTILHTNDLHSRMSETNGDQFGSPCVPPEPCFGGMARLAGLIKAMRGSRNDVLLLDAGDVQTRSLWYEVYRGNASAHFLRLLGYDAMVPGNHDFDSGPQRSIRFFETIKPVVAVSSNIDVSLNSQWNQVEDLIRKSVVFNVSNQSIGICGYTIRYTSSTSNPGINVTFFDEVESVRNCSARLTKEGVKVIIALGHSSMEVDKAVAMEVEEVDLVIGGHMHYFMWTGIPPSSDKPFSDYPLLVKNRHSEKTVPIVQASQYTKYLGNLSLTFDDAGNLLAWEGSPILIDKHVQPDSAIAREVEIWSPLVDAYSSREISKAGMAFEGRLSVCGKMECTLGNLIADALVSFASNISHLAFWDAGSITASINRTAGDWITYGDIYKSFSWQSSVAVLEILGKDLKSMFEHVASSIDPDEPAIQFLQVSGFQVIYDMSKVPQHRVAKLMVKSSKSNPDKFEVLALEQVYKVLTSSWIGSGGQGFATAKNALSLTSLGKTDVEVLEMYLLQNPNISVSIENRISFVRGDNGRHGVNLNLSLHLSSLFATFLLAGLASLLGSF